MFTNTSRSTSNSMLIGCGPQKSNFGDGILEQVGTLTICRLQTNLKYKIRRGGIRPNVWALTFGPPPPLIISE